MTAVCAMAANACVHSVLPPLPIEAHASMGSLFQTWPATDAKNTFRILPISDHRAGLAEFAPAGAKKSGCILVRNSFPGQNSAIAASVEASARGAPRRCSPAQIGAQRSGSDLNKKRSSRISAAASMCQRRAVVVANLAGFGIAVFVIAAIPRLCSVAPPLQTEAPASVWQTGFPVTRFGA